MIQVNKLYCYKLIRYFNKHKTLILNSLVKRQILKAEDSENLIQQIEKDIVELKSLELELTKPSGSISNVRTRVNYLYQHIGHAILKLPNMIHGDTKAEDVEIVEYTQIEHKYYSSMSFNSYTEKYCIRSNGRVIFMDNQLSKLFNSLQNFLIGHNVQHGFELVYGSDIAEDTYMYIAGQLPNLKDFLFKIDENLFCAPTGEVALIEYTVKNFNNIIKQINKNKIVKYCTYTSCYRNEDSNNSSFNKPLIRQSVFHKVESFAVCGLDHENETLDYMLKNVINILEKLKINYRVLKIGSIEMSKSAFIQYDIEVYLPVSKRYVEISSCSSCNIFQLSRDNTNLEKEYEGLYCTLNCSALPLERLLAAYIEYYWNEEKQEFINVIN